MGRKPKTVSKHEGPLLTMQDLPDFVSIRELQTIIREAVNSSIIDAGDYVYFCIQPSFEAVHFVKLYQNHRLCTFMVRNFKNNPIGYFVYFEKYPEHRRISDYGASLFFSENKKKFDAYEDIQVAFADPKFRLVSFDDTDYFASVKWKSNNPLGDTVE